MSIFCILIFHLFHVFLIICFYINIKNAFIYIYIHLYTFIYIRCIRNKEDENKASTYICDVKLIKYN